MFGFMPYKKHSNLRSIKYKPLHLSLKSSVLFIGPVKVWSYGDPWATADSLAACQNACLEMSGCTHYGFAMVGKICLMTDGDFRAMEGDFKAVQFGEL